jgi:hypothetical protein
MKLTVLTALLSVTIGLHASPLITYIDEEPEKAFKLLLVGIGLDTATTEYMGFEGFKLIRESNIAVWQRESCLIMAYLDKRAVIDDVFTKGDCTTFLDK